MNRQFLGRLEGSMVAEYTSSYVFAGSISATETGPPGCESKRDFAMDCEGQWQKAGTLKAVAEPLKFIKKHSVRLLCASLRVGRCMKLYSNRVLFFVTENRFFS